MGAGAVAHDEAAVAGVGEPVQQRSGGGRGGRDGVAVEEARQVLVRVELVAALVGPVQLAPRSAASSSAERAPSSSPQPRTATCPSSIGARCPTRARPGVRVSVLYEWYSPSERRLPVMTSSAYRRTSARRVRTCSAVRVRRPPQPAVCRGAVCRPAAPEGVQRSLPGAVVPAGARLEPTRIRREVRGQTEKKVAELRTDLDIPVEQVGELGDVPAQLGDRDDGQAPTHEGVVGVIPLRALGGHPDPAAGDEVDHLRRQQQEGFSAGVARSSPPLRSWTRRPSPPRVAARRRARASAEASKVIVS